MGRIERLESALSQRLPGEQRQRIEELVKRQQDVIKRQEAEILELTEAAQRHARIMKAIEARVEEIEAGEQAGGRRWVLQAELQEMVDAAVRSAVARSDAPSLMGAPATAVQNVAGTLGPTGRHMRYDYEMIERVSRSNVERARQKSRK